MKIRSGHPAAAKRLRAFETPKSPRAWRVAWQMPNDRQKVEAPTRASRAGAELTERGGRVAEVVPSREDDAAGALTDDPSPAAGSPLTPSPSPVGPARVLRSLRELSGRSVTSHG